MRHVIAPRLAWALLLAPMAAFAQGDPLSLKGYSLGQAMAECPAETRTANAWKDGSTLCSLGPSTLANEPAKDLAVILADGKVVGVIVLLPGRGFGANTSVRDALIDKFGQPTTRKAHVNEYMWERGPQVLSLDGYRGVVILTDIAERRRRAEEAAKANKKDL